MCIKTESESSLKFDLKLLPACRTHVARLHPLHRRHTESLPCSPCQQRKYPDPSLSQPLLLEGDIVFDDEPQDPTLHLASVTLRQRVMVTPRKSQRSSQTVNCGTNFQSCLWEPRGQREYRLINFRAPVNAGGETFPQCLSPAPDSLKDCF